MNILRGCNPSRAFAPRVEGMEARFLPSVAAASGVVRKRAAFSTQYLGPRRADLNLVAASAALKTGKALTLTATTAAPIDATPPTAGLEDASFFVFGLDRGGANSANPFPNRPRIRYDAVVVLQVRPEGLSASVLDASRGNVTTELSPSSVRISGRTIRVVVPPDVATAPGGVPAGRVKFTVWSRNRLEHSLPDIADYVASFLPENGAARIRVVGRSRA